MSLCVLLCLVGAGAHEQTLHPRPGVKKPDSFQLDPTIPRGDIIHLEFNDGLYARLDRGQAVDARSGSLPPANALGKLLAGALIRRTDSSCNPS
ncbi:MAG: hypothetical protein ACI97A_001973 [Planctomycetota bacterium]|jgi:hypothetical protein